MSPGTVSLVLHYLQLTRTLFFHQALGFSAGYWRRSFPGLLAMLLCLHVCTPIFHNAAVFSRHQLSYFATLSDALFFQMSTTVHSIVRAHADIPLIARAQFYSICCAHANRPRQSSRISILPGKQQFATTMMIHCPNVCNTLRCNSTRIEILCSACATRS